MGSYSVRADETELASLVSRAEAAEEIVLSRDGLAVAKIVPFPVAGDDTASVQSEVQRFSQAYGQDGSNVRPSPDSFNEVPSENETKSIKRRAGQNFSGLAGTDLSWLDEPLPEDVQRAFGMFD